MPTIINGLTGIDKIQNGIINVNDISDGSVSEAKLATNAVTNTKIADGSISLSKITPSGTSGQVLTSAGTGSAPTWSTTVGPSSNRIAKAWVNFDGTLSGTITPRASYNVSSVTKNSTGDYTINFTNALSDNNYTMSGSSNDANSSASFIYEKGTYAQYKTTSAFRLHNVNTGGAVVDRNVTAVFFGN